MTTGLGRLAEAAYARVCLPVMDATLVDRKGPPPLRSPPCALRRQSRQHRGKQSRRRDAAAVAIATSSAANDLESWRQRRRRRRLRRRYRGGGGRRERCKRAGSACAMSALYVLDTAVTKSRSKGSRPRFHDRGTVSVAHAGRIRRYTGCSLVMMFFKHGPSGS